MIFMQLRSPNNHRRITTHTHLMSSKPPSTPIRTTRRARWVDSSIRTRLPLNTPSPLHQPSPPFIPQPSQHQQERSYTLGGGGYGGSTVPNIGTDAYGSAAYGYGAGHSPSPPAGGGYGYTESPSTLPIALTTNLPVAGGTPYSNSPVSTAPSGMHNYAASAYQQPHVAAPQPQHSHSGGYDDSPPVYEAGPGQPAAAWNEKGPR